jgi:hypothetical protein
MREQLLSSAGDSNEISADENESISARAVNCALKR